MTVLLSCFTVFSFYIAQVDVSIVTCSASVKLFPTGKIPFCEKNPAKLIVFFFEYS